MSAQKRIYGRTINLEIDNEDDEIVFEKKGQEKTTFIDKIQFRQDQSSLDTIDLYVSINKNFLQNLINEKQIAVKQSQRKQNTGKKIIFKKDIPSKFFAYTFFIYDIQRTDATFEIQIQRKRTQKKWVQSSWRLHYKDTWNWKSQSNSKSVEHSQGIKKLQWQRKDIMNYIQYSHIFLEIHITYTNTNRTQKSNVHRFCGLKNVGNTCYMNSFLQSLYFIQFLRKQIVQKQDEQNHFIKALQQIFGNLMKNNGKTVDPSQIISTNSSWNHGFQFQQRDIHEFKMEFFDQLQKMIPGALKMFQGQVISQVYCKDVEYANETKIVFDEIQLNIVKQDRPIKTIKQSLQFIKQQECLNTQIDTQVHGLHMGYKKIKYTKLPNIIFFNLKRYQYKSTGIHKLMSIFQYESQIDLSFVTQQGQQNKYILYSVLVHKGKQSAEGHYYSYINVSRKVDKSQWYKFNDSYVFKVEQSQVFEQNFGGYKMKNSFHSSSQKFLSSAEFNITTAYILIYIKKDMFQDIQNVQTIIPQKLLLNISQQQQQRDSADIKVSVVLSESLLQKNLSVFHISEAESFGKKIVLQPKKSIKQSIDKILKVASKQGTQYSVWKISSNKTVLNLQREYSQKSILTYYALFQDNKNKLGFDFYILLIPTQQQTWMQTNFSLKPLSFQKLFLVFNYITYFNDLNQFVCEIESIEIIMKSELHKLSSKLLSQYDNNVMFQKNKKVIDIAELNLSGKNMYCEIARSYLEIDENYFLKPKQNVL